VVIRRSKGGGFEVRSKKGKRLSKRGLSHAAAVKRLQQVEFFKHKKR
jgi:hypothetical protein